MLKENEMENNKIGAAIQYFRESYQISQSKLCKGLCSVATLSRIEAGERDADSLLLETLLERLGKMSNQFELILTDSDYVLYQNREEIKRNIEEKNYEEAYALLREYDKIASSKGNVHIQYVLASRAMLNEMNGGTINDTIEMLLKAFTYTVPDFMKTGIKDNYLSNGELTIIINVIQHMLSASMIEQAKDLLLQVLEYLDEHNSVEENNRLYPKVASIATRLYIGEQDLEHALEMCNRGVEKNKGNRKMDYLGELIYLKAQIQERSMLTKHDPEVTQKECMKLYLQAYYVFYNCEEFTIAEEIKKHLQEEFQWEDID